MWAGLTGTTEGALAGEGTDHRNSDCWRVGVKGGLRIGRNKKYRRREEGPEGTARAIWFWLLHVEAVVG